MQKYKSKARNGAASLPALRYMASPLPWLLMPFSICFLFSIDVVVSCPFLFHVAVVVAAACRQTIKMMRCIARCCCCCCCPHPPIYPPSPPQHPLTITHATQHTAAATSSPSPSGHMLRPAGSSHMLQLATFRAVVLWHDAAHPLGQPPRALPCTDWAAQIAHLY